MRTLDYTWIKHGYTNLINFYFFNLSEKLVKKKQKLQSFFFFYKKKKNK